MPFFVHIVTIKLQIISRLWMLKKKLAKKHFFEITVQVILVFNFLSKKADNGVLPCAMP